MIYIGVVRFFIQSKFEPFEFNSSGNTFIQILINLIKVVIFIRYFSKLGTPNLLQFWESHGTENTFLQNFVLPAEGVFSQNG